MAANAEDIDPLEDLREELGKMVTIQKSQLSKQDTAIASIANWIKDLTGMLQELQRSMGALRGPEAPAQKASRSIRLDLPKFQGTDPEGWIFQAEEYFSFHGILDDSRIQIAGFHMTKGALGWMRGLCRNNLLSTWDKFKEDLRERFGSTNLGDRLQELSHIQQTTSVAAYLEKFEDLLNEVSGQSEATLISFLISGLGLELKNELNIIKPTSLRKAFALAKV